MQKVFGKIDFVSTDLAVADLSFASSNAMEITRSSYK